MATETWPIHVGLTERRTATPRPPSGLALLPGAFHPVHAGHWRLADAAAERLGRPVAFEVSVANVDKPTLAADEVERRLQQFAGRAEVWLTHAPRFLEKARWFRECTFVIGADTAARLLAARYYDGDLIRRDAALATLREAACTFLTAVRVDLSGRVWRLQDLEIPPACREMFLELPESRFRLDISSTEIRTSRRGAGPDASSVASNQDSGAPRTP